MKWIGQLNHDDIEKYIDYMWILLVIKYTEPAIGGVAPNTSKSSKIDFKDTGDGESTSDMFYID